MYLVGLPSKHTDTETETSGYLMSESDQDNRFFKVILSSIADGVFTIDEKRRITSFNPTAERITVRRSKTYHREEGL